MAPRKSSKNKQPQEETHGEERRRKIRQPRVEEMVETSEEEMEQPTLDIGQRGPKVRAGMYLDQGEIMEVTGNLLFTYLEDASLSLFTTFTTNWFPDIVEQFYNSVNLVREYYEDDDDDEDSHHPMIACSFVVNGVSGVISEKDLVRAFGMKRDGVSEYPVARWSSNWPIGLGECVKELSNDRPALKPNQVSKANMNGIQKLVSKVVMGIILPTNSQASELSFVHAFITWALLNYEEVNFPYMILTHMCHQKSKPPLQYGMILSYLLVTVKNVPVLEHRQVHVKKDSMIGKQSLITQNVYMWDGDLRSKWEIFENYEFVRNDVWKFNNCKPPVPPVNWKPSSGAELVYEIPTSMPTEHGGAGPSSTQSEHGMLESINIALAKLLSDNDVIKGEMAGIRGEYRSLREEMTGMNVHMGTIVGGMQAEYRTVREEMTQMRTHMGDISRSMDSWRAYGGPPPPPPADDMDDEETHD